MIRKLSGHSAEDAKSWHTVRPPTQSGAKTESYRHPPMHRVKQPGGKSAIVAKSPRRGCSSY